MTTRSRTEVGIYLTLKDGTEIQITGFNLVKNEGFFCVRYPDRIMTGDSYQIPEGEIYNAKFSAKYK